MSAQATAVQQQLQRGPGASTRQSLANGLSRTTGLQAQGRAIGQTQFMPKIVPVSQTGFIGIWTEQGETRQDMDSNKHLIDNWEAL